LVLDEDVYCLFGSFWIVDIVRNGFDKIDLCLGLLLRCLGVGFENVVFFGALFSKLVLLELIVMMNV